MGEIMEICYYKYGPKNIFDYVKQKLIDEDKHKKVNWNRETIVKKCKTPTEISRIIIDNCKYKEYKLYFVILNDSRAIESIVLRIKYYGKVYYVELKVDIDDNGQWNYGVKYIAYESPYTITMSLLDGARYESIENAFDQYNPKPDIKEKNESSDVISENCCIENDVDDSDDQETENNNYSNVSSERIFKRIKGIQFDKQVLQGVTLAETMDFCKTMAKKLEYIERFTGGDVRAAGKTLRFLRRKNGKRIVKYRLGKRRYMMLMGYGILTCIGLSTHDKQIRDIEKYQMKQAGMVYYDINEFLNRIKTYNDERKVALSKYLMMPQHYVLSEDQEKILGNRTNSLNMSIVGNAGAGKSLIGMKWIAEEFSKENNKCLYLTMSSNLVYALREQFDIESLGKRSSVCDVESIGEFIFSRMKIAYPQIPDRRFLDSKQSFEQFKLFWKKKIHHDYSQLMEYWRAIHGYIKGALPLDIKLKGKIKLPEYIDEETYVWLREAYGEKNYLSWDECFKVYKKYQEYLKFAHLYDDNDLAKMLIITNKWKKGGYSSVFIDECQDLTQVQIMALLCQLRGTRSKVFSSDRCQMVQPVWFKEGSMRTLANEMDKIQGKKVNPQGIKAHYLHYNFRSTKSVINFQNSIVNFFRESGVLSLKQMEMMEISIPASAKQGIKPIWVQSNMKNRDWLTKKLWETVTGIDLQIIIANNNLPTVDCFGIEGRLAVDIVECKGMEYPSVLMFNVMKDAQRDIAMAWKYFYVASTRSSDVLIIYDDITEENENVKRYFQDAVCRGVLDICTDLTLPKPDYNGSWSSYIEKQVMRSMTKEERLEIANTAMNYEQYKLAYGIYSEYTPEDEITIYCRAKVYEQDRKYKAAINTYAKLSEDWHDRGRNRNNCIDEITKMVDINKCDYIAAMILGYYINENFFEYAMYEYKGKYGCDSDFQENLWKAVEEYEFAAELMAHWMDIVTDYIRDKSIELEGRLDYEREDNNNDTSVMKALIEEDVNDG